MFIFLQENDMSKFEILRFNNILIIKICITFPISTIIIF